MDNATISDAKVSILNFINKQRVTHSCKYIDWRSTHLKQVLLLLMFQSVTLRSAASLLFRSVMEAQMLTAPGL